MSDSETPGDDATPAPPTHVSRETQAALQRAHDLIDRLHAGGTNDPSILDRLTGPSARLKAQIEAELVELELIAQGLGI